MGIYLPEKSDIHRGRNVCPSILVLNPTGLSVYNGIKHTCLNLYIGIGIKHIICLLV